jgi:hypothetical protein
MQAKLLIRSIISIYIYQIDEQLLEPLSLCGRHIIIINHYLIRRQYVVYVTATSGYCEINKYVRV